MSKISEIPKAEVAVFVGSAFDYVKGRGGKGEPIRKTPWGKNRVATGRNSRIQDS
jgi:hypothetical protein